MAKHSSKEPGAKGETSGTDVASLLGRPLHGDSGPVRELAPFPNPKPFSLSFLSAEDLAEVAAPPAGALVLARPALTPRLRAAGYAVIESDHPKFDLARVSRAFFEPASPPGVHPSAVIGPEVVLGASASIGPGCVLDGRLEVGVGAVLAAHVRLCGPARIGAGVRIGSCAVIGEEAFSFGFGPEGEGLRFPATGGVEIGDHVEIGPSTFVAAGIFDATVLETGAKLADLVSISNAVHVGRNSIVTARVAISGRARIGADCWLGQSAAVRQGVSIGDGALVGMGAVVVKDVPPGAVVMGNPATVRKSR